MKDLKDLSRFCAKALVAGAALMAASAATGASKDSAADWQYGVVIYGWLPSISGDLKYNPPGSSGDIDVDAGKIIDALQFTFMGSFETRKGAWSGFTDVIYLDLAGDQSKSVSVSDGATSTLFDADLQITG